MADIALGAEIRSEFLASFLQEINSHCARVAPHGASGTQPHQFNDATGDPRCQIQNVVDRNPVVDDIVSVDVQLLEESGKKATKIVVRGPEGRAQDWNRLAICGSVRMTCKASLVPSATMDTRSSFERNFKTFKAALCSRGVQAKR